MNSGESVWSRLTTDCEPKDIDEDKQETTKTNVTIGSALSGAVLGAALQESLNTPLRLAASAVTVLCIFSVGFLTFFSVHAESATEAQEKILEQAKVLSRGYTSMGESVASLVDARADTILMRLANLTSLYGIEIEVQLVSQINAMQDIEQDPSSRLMVGASRRDSCT